MRMVDVNEWDPSSYPAEALSRVQWPKSNGFLRVR
jgi:hypothetical protein